MDPLGVGGNSSLWCLGLSALTDQASLPGAPWLDSCHPSLLRQLPNWVSSTTCTSFTGALNTPLVWPLFYLFLEVYMTCSLLPSSACE